MVCVSQSISFILNFTALANNRNGFCTAVHSMQKKRGTLRETTRSRVNLIATAYMHSISLLSRLAAFQPWYSTWGLQLVGWRFCKRPLQSIPSHPINPFLFTPIPQLYNHWLIPIGINVHQYLHKFPLVNS